jgi:hypothetical protein
VAPKLQENDHYFHRVVRRAGFYRKKPGRCVKNEPGIHMPELSASKRAREDARQGKSPSTQAGEFVREEFHHVRNGKHGARSAKQAIAIGLSKARRAGVKLPPPAPGKSSDKIRRFGPGGQFHD